MSRLSTKQRRSARRRRQGYDVLRWLEGFGGLLAAALDCPAQPWFNLKFKEIK